MANGSLPAFLRHLRRLAARHESNHLSDRQLLRRFLSERDEMAFAVLVARHGLLVLAAGRRVLHDGHAAEDVFQATFLVLARKAAAIRKQESLASWLYGVAHRLAVRAKIQAAKRNSHEQRGEGRSPAEPASGLVWGEMGAVLDEELMRLPEKYRAPLVLCYLEGQTQDEAARQLGWARTTLRDRLDRGRELLRGRLERRGVLFSTGLLATALSQWAASAAVSAALLDATVEAALAFGMGEVLAGAAATQAVSLAKGALQAMFVTKLKVVAVAVMTVGLLGMGAGGLTHRLLAEKQATEAQPNALKPVVPVADPPKPRPADDKQARTDRYGDPLPEGALARMGTIRLRTGAQVVGVAFSPDGKTVFSQEAGPENKLRLWDFASGKEIRRMTKPAKQKDWVQNEVRSSTVSPDGKYVAGIGQYGPIWIWEVATGKLLRTWSIASRIAVGAPGGNSDAFAIAYSPDGRSLVTVAPAILPIAAGVCLWDPATSKELRRFPVRRGQVHAVAFSPDGRILAAGTVDKTICFWDTATGQEVRRIERLPTEAEQVVFSPDGKTLATVGRHIDPGPPVWWRPEQRVRLWDVATGKQHGQLVVREDLEDNVHGFRSFVYHPDGKLIATGGDDDIIRLWDPATGKEQQKWSGAGGSFSSLAFSPDGRALVSGNWQTGIGLWDVASGKNLVPFGGHISGVYHIALSPDGQSLATTSSDNTVRLWKTATGKEIHRLAEASARAYAVDGQTVVATTFDGTIRFWEAATGRERRRIPITRAGACPLALSADGAWLASIDQENTVCLWALATKEKRRLFKAPQGQAAISTLAFAPDGKTLLAWGGDHTVFVWDVVAGKELRHFTARYLKHNTLRAAPGQPQPGEDHVSCVAFSPDGRRVALGGGAAAILVYDTGTGQETHRITGIPDNLCNAIAFAPDGRTVASGGLVDSTIRLWELATGGERRHFSGHEGGVDVVAFSPDGRRVVSGARDTTALVWDRTGRGASAASPKIVLAPAEWEKRWDELGSPNAADAEPAIWALIAYPGQTVKFFQARLQPVPQVDPQRLTQLVTDLDSKEFARRDKAVQDLTSLGELAEPALQGALKKKPPLEVRRRIEQLLDKRQKEGPSPGELRAVRAMEVLEYLGTPEARHVLAPLAQGAPQARLTQEAKASLERLALRPVEKP
jgi:RNA polymerase sigma factor (sigma-70 family)